MSVTLATLASLIGPALNVIQAFRGDATAAAADSKINDAVDLIVAVVPLIESVRGGTEVTREDVNMALDGMDDALATLDAEIARQDNDADDAA